MSIKRYNVLPWDRYHVSTPLSDSGKWVEYDDHVAEVERLTLERDYLYQKAVREQMRTPGGFNEDQATSIIDRALAALVAVGAEGSKP